MGRSAITEWPTAMPWIGNGRDDGRGVALAATRRFLGKLGMTVCLGRGVSGEDGFSGNERADTLMLTT